MAPRGRGGWLLKRPDGSRAVCRFGPMVRRPPVDSFTIRAAPSVWEFLGKEAQGRAATFAVYVGFQEAPLEPGMWFSIVLVNDEYPGVEIQVAVSYRPDGTVRVELGLSREMVIT